jgi:hypothetical protein
MCHNFPRTLLFLSSPSVTASADTHFFYQEFGIDIVGEDNKTIVHHKVAACFVCVLTEQKALLIAHVEYHHIPISCLCSDVSSSPTQRRDAFQHAVSHSSHPFLK